MKRIIYVQDNGILAIIIPSPKWKGTIEGLAQKDVPDGFDYEIVDVASIPSDRYFRGAWRKNGVNVDIDMPKARDIHMSKIRSIRNKELERLDIEQLKGNDVAAQKQALRDLPDNFDLSGATTPEELKALWPNELSND